MAATATAEAPRDSAGRRLAGFLWRRPKLSLGLLLAAPIGWLVIAYLGSLAVLFAASFWHLDTFSGATTSARWSSRTSTARSCCGRC